MQVGHFRPWRAERCAWCSSWSWNPSRSAWESPPPGPPGVRPASA